MKPTSHQNSDQRSPGTADATAPETTHHDSDSTERTVTHLKVIAAGPDGVETLLVPVDGDENGETTHRVKPDLARILARLQALPACRGGCPGNHPATTPCTYQGPSAASIKMAS
ncbi:hypothetical protein [Amycolatopsis sp. NPDC051102]|uniref:hypothetical protein n=1 Tax=Amycolatopsis sp. NPDC051102 TaxID=3155163 RepID=UPI00342EE6D4